MKPKLIILSDLWGFDQAVWLQSYITVLSPFYDLHLYDSCILGEIDVKGTSEAALHSQFVTGGIEKAVNAILAYEKERADVLAFSIGGAIAWKAILKGLEVNRFFAISSTRIRHESYMPDCEVNLFFGEKDVYQPAGEWLEKVKITHEIIKDKGHEMYKEEEIIKRLCHKITSNMQQQNDKRKTEYG